MVALVAVLAVLAALVVLPVIMIALALLVMPRGWAPGLSSWVPRWFWARSPPPRATVTPPSRALTAGDKILARLLNSVDHDMRSVELGRWFVHQLRQNAPAGPCSPDALPLAAIADRVPRANAVTKAELTKHLADLVREACAQPNFVRALDAFEAAAFDAPDGVLLGMPGYALASPVPLM